MRRIILLLFILSPLLCYAGDMVTLMNMRVQPSLTMTRFSFLLSNKACGTLKYFPNPDRVTIDIEKTSKSFNLKNVKLAGSNVLTVNSEEIANGTLRFTLTTKGKVRWDIKIFPYEKKGAVVLQIDIISATESKKMLKPNEKFSRLEQVNQILKYNVVAAVEKNLVKTAAKKSRIFTVVIDAGHGGKDSGARGVTGVEEKAVVLSIARKLANEINQKPGMRAVLTRKGDYFVPLRERMEIARKKQGDIFIAVHADGYFNTTASGASVYALSQHGATTEAARWLARRDNYSELGGVELNELQDRSPMLRSVLIDLSQTATIQDSLHLGGKVLDNLDDVSSLHYKRVEQAPFMVLKAPDMPSILIETGFISNPSEEKRLTDSHYQDQIAHAIYLGINHYRQKYADLGN